jgi:Peptidase family M23
MGISRHRADVLTLILVQLALPLGVLAWLALWRHPTRVAWGLAVALAGALFALLHLAGLWLVLPWYLPAAYGLVGFPAAVVAWRRLRGPWRRPLGATEWAGAWLRAIAAGCAIAAVAYAMLGRRGPDRTVDLAFTLHQGTYLVANGGSIGLLNAHVSTLEAPRFAAYRGQSYGVDLVRVNRYGLRAHGLQPPAVAEYRIFGDSVFSPCAGRVISTTDGLADQPVPEVDRTHMAGNHVLLSCGSAWVLLGHLQAGSVRVESGESVHVGTPLGRVGNTGNTSEPHLHLHAQRPGTDVAPLSGEPLPIRLDGRYLARNDRITSRP